jgi:uncharacterized membrane protein
MADWLEHSLQVEVPAPIEVVWALWSDLESMPKWIQWIDSVVINPTDPDLSRWKLAANGLEFSWQARNTRVIPNQIIQWESIDGLPNRGAVRFYDRGEAGSVVKMSIAYAMPGRLGPLMDKLFIGRIVESTLASSLERFKADAIASAQSSGQSSPS